MKSKEIIIEIYYFLCCIYYNCKDGYCSPDSVLRKKNKSPIIRSIDVNHLLDSKLVEGNCNEIHWIGEKPIFKTAYDFFYYLKGQTKCFADLEELIQHPEDVKPNELMDALAITELSKRYSEDSENVEILELHDEIKQPNDSKKSNQDDTINLLILEELRRLNDKLNPDGVTDSTNDRYDSILKLLGNHGESIQKVLNRWDDLYELLVMIKDLLIDSNTSIKNAQSSVSRTIAVSQTNQKNLFEIMKINHVILEAILYLMSSGSTPEEGQKVLSHVQFALQRTREAIENNSGIEATYYNGKKKQ
jgi:hypothetical protein